MAELVYGDLVAGPAGTGVPWRAGGTDPATGLDCKGLVLLVLRRMGRAVPDHAVFGSADCSEGALERYLAEQEELWPLVPRAERLGDVVISSGSEWPHEPHLSVLVDDIRRLVLTSSRGRGVMAVPLAWVARIREARRYAGP